MLRSVPDSLLNWIVRDLRGGLYGADEANHAVFCWDAEGRIWWRRGDFIYPRGLDFGQIRRDGEVIDVVGVADAWNRRVQFLDLDGNSVAVWASWGDVSFAEVSDVRFLGESWLVLDSGNHCLFTMGMDGTALNRTGRCLPPALQLSWAAPRIFFSEDPFSPAPGSEYPPVDFLYYPDRILGDDLHRLFIWEPLAGTLKALVPPFLLPLQLTPGNATEWLAADSSGFLGWRPSDSRIVRTNASGYVILETDVAGERVVPGRSPNEAWVQRGEFLERRQLPGAETDASHSGRTPDSLLAASAQADLARFDIWKFSQSVTDCILLSGEELAIDGYILQTAGVLDDIERLKHAVECIPLVQARRPEQVQKMGYALNPWCLGLLKYGLSGSAPDVPAQLRSDVRGLNQTFRDQIHFRLKEIDTCRQGLAAAAANPSERMKASPLAAEAWSHAAERAMTSLQNLRNWIGSWSGLD